MFDVVSLFHIDPGSKVLKPEGALEMLRPLAVWLAAKDSLLTHWYLGGYSLEEALRYEAFVDGVNGNTSCVAVLNTEQKKEQDGSFTVFLWNGENSPKDGASLVMNIWTGPFPAKATLRLGGNAARPRIGDYEDTAEFVGMVVRGTRPECVFVYDESGYGNKQTFKDRPGVGWMLYLPRVFTPQELPEARALLPVLEGKERLGTIIVSVTDAVFDDNNPEHLQIAREIETRMVSNDWLPTWAQMVRPAT